jgi:hypothetical protein
MCRTATCVLDFANNPGEAIIQTKPSFMTKYKVCRAEWLIGFRWGEEGKWNLLPKNASSQQEILAELSCIDSKDEVVSVGFPHFEPGEGDLLYRNVPVRKLKMANGEEALVTSVFDMQVAQYGIDRGGRLNVAKDYNAMPTWPIHRMGIKVTGIKAMDIERTGRIAMNASQTHGKSMVIMGAAPTWYPQRHDVPERHEHAAPMRLRRPERRRLGALRRSGKTQAASRLGAHRLRPGLAPSAAPHELHLLLVFPHRPVALRNSGCRQAVVACRKGQEQGLLAGGLQRCSSPHGLAAGLSSMERQSARSVDEAARRCYRRSWRFKVRCRNSSGSMDISFATRMSITGRAHLRVAR